MRKSLSFDSKLYLLLVLLLLSSPALSITGLLGLGYIPNEKIALLLVLANKYAWLRRFRNFRIISLVVSSIILLLTTLQIFHFSSGLPVPELNTCLILLSIPFYASFLSYKSENTVLMIFYVGLFQLGLSLIQQMFMQNGVEDVIKYFNNYPPQSNYRYPLGEIGWFYRTSGLFTESSAYAVFQWIAIICGFKAYKFNNTLGILLLLVLILEVFFNGSLTGYLFFILYFSMRGYKSFLGVFFAIISLMFLVTPILSQILNFEFNLIQLWWKLSQQVLFLFQNQVDYSEDSAQWGRLFGLVRAFIIILNSDVLLYGFGLSWKVPTLDFYSLYFKAFGLIGISTLTLYLIYILRHTSLPFAIATLGVISINGHLSTTINIILISLCFLVLNKKKYDVKRS